MLNTLKSKNEDVKCHIAEKKHFLFSAMALLIFVSAKSQIYMGKTCEISFFSAATMENITAVNKTTKPILNTSTGDIFIKISVGNFEFANALMKEHFNENYMETDKEGAKDAKGVATFPNKFSIFKGKINEKVDYKKDGMMKITVTGKLDIHGVTQDRTIDAVLTIKGGVITVDSKFNVALKDHNITIPELLFQKIATSVEVKIHADLTEGGK